VSRIRSLRSAIETIGRLVLAAVFVLGSVFVIPSLVNADSNETSADSTTRIAQSSLSTGMDFTCAITSSGTAKCWGNNTSGRLGIGSAAGSVSTPTDVAGLANATQISIGFAQGCALNEAGGVLCWGANNFGQLGVGDNANRTSAAALPALASGATQISVGQDHACAVMTDGVLKCWGSGADKQLGFNQASTNVPVAVAGLQATVSMVATGDNFTCALLTNGAVQCWGENLAGQVGAAPQQSCAFFDPFMGCMFFQAADEPPTVVGGLSGSSVTALSAGYNHACALMADKTVRCWGSNLNTRLGSVGADTHQARTVTGLTDVQAISTGYSHTCALLVDQAVKCWGANSGGQLGDNTAVDKSSPTAVSGLSGVLAISAGRGFTCASLTGGAIKCWGENYSYQLGLGKTRDVLQPYQVAALASGVAEIYSGGSHACALTTDGQLKCWGSNTYGQVGVVGDAVISTPTLVNGLTSGQLTVTSVALGYDHSCAGLSDGTMKCWGRGLSGQLGRGANTDSSVPTSPSNLGGVQVAKVFAGRDSSCLVTVAGSVKCWGANFSGQLGDGTTTSRNVPTDVVGFGNDPVLDIQLGYYHSCFLHASNPGNGVKCFGVNQIAHLRMIGAGVNTASILTPTAPVGLSSGVADVRVGRWHTCARMTDKTVKCWGDNNAGELGNGLPSGDNSGDWVVPTDVPGLSGVEQLDIGDRHTCAILSSGALTCWGSNGQGEQATGDTTERRVPTAVAGMASNVTKIAAGGIDGTVTFTCSMKSGLVYCWGSDLRGQVTQGYVTSALTPRTVAGSFEVATGATTTTTTLPPVVYIPPPLASSTAAPSVSVPTSLATETPKPTTPVLERAVAISAPAAQLGLPPRVAGGQTVDVVATDLTPGAEAEVFIASDPMFLGSARVDASGRMKLSVTIPAGMIGRHSIVIRDTSSGQVKKQAIEVVAPRLPVTGSESGNSSSNALILVLVGLLLIVVERRVRISRTK
jgi:alpha-tubulin suppressor-like RCC1 family protein